MGERSEELKNFEYLWDGSEQGWILFCLNPSEPASETRYVIENEITKMALIIEDDDEYEEVIIRMQNAGVKVVTA